MTGEGDPFPRLMLTVDVVVLNDAGPPEVLLVQRGNPPFAGAWALPGGFVEQGEQARLRSPADPR